MQFDYLTSKCNWFCLTALLLCLSPTAVPHAGEMGAAYYDFGVFAFEENDFSDAERNFQKALAADPRNVSYRYYLGKTYLKMKRYEKAEAILNEVFRENADLKGLKYDLAMANFHLGDLAEASFLLSIVVAENPADVLATYHLAVCQYKRKRYRDALEYFNRAAEKNPGIGPNCSLYAGICHYRLGELEQAVREFDAAAVHEKPEEIRQQARQWRNAVQADINAQRPYRLFCKLGGLYDDNVSLQPVDGDLATNEEDWGLIGFLSGSYRLLGDNRNGLGMGYRHYQIAYRELSDYNLISSAPHLFASVSWERLAFILSYQPTFFWVGSDEYLLRHHGRQEIAWTMTPRITSRFAFNYYGNNYLINSGRSGRTLGVEAELRYRFGNDAPAVFGGFSCEENDTTHPDYAYKLGEARLGASMPMPLGLLVTAGGRFARKRYEHVDSVYGDRREDDKYAIELTVGRNLYRDWLGAECSYYFTHNDSDIEPYDYRSNVIHLTVVANF
ncbi:MAG: surface lipoprotein assembly modifier [Thermodesulfobacteriota bacterium]